MNEQELKKLWQQQPLNAPPKEAPQELPVAMEQRTKHFGRTIFWRDVREVAACVFIVFAFLPNLFRPASMLTKAGCVLLVLSAIYIGCRLVLSKRRGDRRLTTHSIRNYLQDELRKVEVQIHLLRTVLWWYIMPLYIGAVMVVAGRANELGFKVTFSLGYAVVCAGIWWLNQYVVKKTLLPLKADLEQTLQEFTEPSATETDHE